MTSASSPRKRKANKNAPSPLENGEVRGVGPSGESFALFYGGAHPFSNFYPSPFTLEGKSFVNGEQYFHWRKAVLFGDAEMAEEILHTDDPRKHKGLGRKVRNYDDAAWSAEDVGVMEAACRAKFTQSAELRERLLATKGSRIVEASPRDRKWGVGLGVGNPDALDPAKWRGRNLLGEVLTRLRDQLLEEQEAKE